MLTLQISEETLTNAINETLNSLFKADNYNNPLKKLVEGAVGSSYSKGSMTAIIEEKIVCKINEFIDTDNFNQMLGEAVAKAIADREVSKGKK